MERALITYAWNRVAYIVNRSLSTKGVQTFLGDLDRLHLNRFSIYSYKNFQYPNFYTNPDKFVDFIIKYSLKHKIEYIFPIHEEIFIFSKFKKNFEKKGLKLLISDFEQIKKAHKKNLSIEIAKSIGIPVPLSIFPKTFEDMRHFFNENKKIVLKYINTNSAKGVFYPKNVNDLKIFEKDISKFILQEFVDGTGYGVSMLYNRGQLRAKFTHKRLQEKIHTGGTSILRESCKNLLLEDYAEKILSSLNWNGVAMVEFKFNEKLKKGWFIEINPRFWGSLALPYYAGIDFPYLMFKILQDGDIEQVINYKTGVKVKWILGGYIAFITDLIKRRKIQLDYILSKADAYDDWWYDDKKIFLGELIFYFSKFILSMKLNPTKNSMLNIDDL